MTRGALLDSAPSIRFGAYEAAVLADSPVVYHKAGTLVGTTAADMSGNGHLGTYTGTYTLGGAGPFSYEDSYAQVLVSGAALTDSFNPFSGTMTYEGWAIITNSTSAGRLFGGQDTTTFPRLQLTGGARTLSWRRNNFNASQASWTGTPRPADNNWFHWVLVDNPNVDATLYINGALVSTQAHTVPFSTTGNLVWGRAGGTNAIVGSQAHLAVYTGALSSGRISAHYAARTG